MAKTKDNVKPKKRGRPSKKDKGSKKAQKTGAKKEVKVKKDKKPVPKNYIFAVGRRKSAVARIRYFKNEKNKIIINNRDFRSYFSTFDLQKIVRAPLELVGHQEGLISVRVKGGGKRGQAEAIRHGIARALVQYQPELKKTLKKAGFLTRDPRVKERKKYGLKRARRAPQWQKR